MGEPGSYHYRKKRKFRGWIDSLKREKRNNGPKFSIVYRMYEKGLTSPDLYSREGKYIRYIGKSDKPVTRYNTDSGRGEIKKSLIGFARNTRTKFNLGVIDYCVIRGRWREKWAAAEECIQYHKHGGKKNLKNQKHPERPSNGCPICD